jgi:sporulation protein YlmC with PRC-barrel domain
MSPPVLAAGHRLDAALRLLDRQILDVDGRMVAKVDDVELREEDGRLIVTGLLVGPAALGPRLGGPLGAWIEAVWRRLAGRRSPGPGRIDLADVEEIQSAVTLSISRQTANVDGFENWVRDRIISALPGAGHDPE